MIKNIPLGVPTTFTPFNSRSKRECRALHAETALEFDGLTPQKLVELRDRVVCVGPHLAACSSQRDLIRATHSTPHPARRGKSQKRG